MKFEDIKKVNETIMTIDVKGKQYAEVNQRIKAFRMLYPEGIIDTKLENNENGVCVFKAQVGYYEEDGCVRWLGTGYAYEKESIRFCSYLPDFYCCLCRLRETNGGAGANITNSGNRKSMVRLGFYGRSRVCHRIFLWSSGSDC